MTDDPKPQAAQRIVDALYCKVPSNYQQGGLSTAFRQLIEECA
jgi:hypothetical protein